MYYFLYPILRGFSARAKRVQNDLYCGVLGESYPSMDMSRKGNVGGFARACDVQMNLGVPPAQHGAQSGVECLG